MRPAMPAGSPNPALPPEMRLIKLLLYASAKALPKPVATDENARAIAEKAAVLAVPMMFGPGDPLLALGLLHPDLAAVCPYVSGVVELDGTQGEGARMLVNIIDCEPEEIGIGSILALRGDLGDS